MANLEKILEEIQSAEKEGDHGKQADACSRAGQVYLERNLYQEAVYYYQAANRLYAENEDRLNQARALNHLGVCQIMENQPKKALESLNLALEILGADPEVSLKASIQGNLGLAYGALKDFKNSFKAHKTVLESAETNGNDPLRLTALINLADISLQDQNYRPAQGFALVALDLAKKLSPHPGLMIIYDLLGMISARQGDLKSAVEYHEQAFQEAQTRGDLLRQGIALANQGLALEGLTELERAFSAMTQAQEIFSMLNSDYKEKTRRDLERIQKGLSV